MLRRWRLFGVIGLASLAWPIGAELSGQGQSEARQVRPSLVVVVSVDGLSWPTLAKYRPWYTSGLKRLLDEGYAFTGTHYQHLNTETAPGHAALAAGAPPRVTGIVANRWLMTGPDGAIRSVYATQMPASLGPPGGPLVGPGNLKVDTLGDRLVATTPGSRVVSVSAKDRTAVLLAGRNPRHLVYWFDQDTGRFVTSPYYDTQGPAGGQGRALVSAFNASSAGPILQWRFGTAWTPLPAPARVTGYGLPALPQPESGMAEFQAPSNGLGFPHDLTFGQRGYFTGFYNSPFSDDLVTDLAMAFLLSEPLGLGRGGGPDLLYVGLSAQDTVSHSYGPESPENLDLLRRLDLNVGRLLDTLAARGFTRERVVLALGADHGFAPIPEVRRLREPGFAGGRLVEGDRALPNFYQRLNRLVAETLCLPSASRPIFGGEGWSLIYNRPALPMRTVEGPCGPAGRSVGAADLDRALPGVVRRFFAEEIDAVLPIAQRDSWPRDDRAVAFALNDLDIERSGDAFLIPREGVLMHWDPVRGTGHGTHHAYDTHVPLVFWGDAWPAGSSSAATTPYDLAPTLAERLGITLPDATGAALRPGGAGR